MLFVDREGVERDSEWVLPLREIHDLSPLDGRDLASARYTLLTTPPLNHQSAGLNYILVIVRTSGKRFADNTC